MFKEPPNYEEIRDSKDKKGTQDNPYEVDIIAGGDDQQAIQTIRISVQNVYEAPEFADPSVELNLNEHRARLNYKPQVKNPDGAALTFNFERTGADFEFFYLSKDRDLYIRIIPNYEYLFNPSLDPPRLNRDYYELVIVASDNQQNITKQNVKVNILDVDERPEFVVPSALTFKVIEHNPNTNYFPETDNSEQDKRDEQERQDMEWLGTERNFTTGTSTLEIGDGKDGSLFRLTDDGQLVFRTPPDYETIAASDNQRGTANNPYEVDIIASYIERITLENRYSNGPDEYLVDYTVKHDAKQTVFIEVFDAPPAQYLTISNSSAVSDFGTIVANTGDINNDGIDDLALTYSYVFRFVYGKAFVIFGQGDNKINPNKSLDVANFEDAENAESGFVLNRSASLPVYSIASAGDINGDGIGDVVVGTPASRVNGHSFAGSSFVIFGKETTDENPYPFPTTVDLSNLKASDGFAIHGHIADGQSGKQVAPVGDVNDDGIDDIIINASGAGETPRQSYVIFGRQRTDDDPNPFPAIVELEDLNGTNGFTIYGHQDQSVLGQTISNAGDVNGDGIDDLIFGGPFTRNENNERISKSYVIFGKRKANENDPEPFPARIDLTNLQAPDGFVIQSDEGSAGHSVSSAGDLNNDGIGDIIVGAPNATVGSNAGAGKSFVIFGKQQTEGNPHPFDAALNLDSIGADDGFVIHGYKAKGFSGYVVSHAGDVNGDLIDDIIIGTKASANQPGEIFVIFGRDTSNPFGATFNLQDLYGTNGFIASRGENGDLFGTSVASAGDFNGDGFGDVIVGAPNANRTGEAYIIFGQELFEARSILMEPTATVVAATYYGDDF